MSTLLCLAVLGAGEILCRIFSDAPFLGISKNLIIPNAFGDSKGNAPNIKGVSFGADIYTNGEGFRIDPEFSTIGHGPAILILGDSVSFGPGVPESRTFAGLLRRLDASRPVYNSSVIGYDLQDYKNVVERVAPAHPDIRAAYLSFCLNDLSPRSAGEIDRALANPDAVERVKGLPVLSGLNEFLRMHSKLFLVLKNSLLDNSRRYFDAEVSLYDIDQAAFERSLQPLTDVERMLRERGIPLTVMVMPYEAQLRRRTPSDLKPQQRVLGFCNEHRIRCVNMIEPLTRGGFPPKKLFLGGDPMHLSEAGHRLVFEWLKDDLQGTMRNAATANGAAGPESRSNSERIRSAQPGSVVQASGSTR